MAPSAVATQAPSRIVASSIRSQLTRFGIKCRRLAINCNSDSICVKGKVESFTQKFLLIEWAKGQQIPTHVNDVQVD